MPNIRPQWPTAADFAEKVMINLERDHAPEVAPKRVQMKTAVEALFKTPWWLHARKMSRLCENLKLAIEREAFGPLFVDADRNRIAPADYDPENPDHATTQAYQIFLAFKDIYKTEYLDQVDEEGEPL